MNIKALPIYVLLLTGIGVVATNLKSNSGCGTYANYAELAVAHVQKEYAWDLADIANTQVESYNDCKTVSVTVTHVDDVKKRPEDINNEDL